MFFDSGLLFYIATGPKGRGLFARCDIPPRTLLHVAPCIPISSKQYQAHMQFTVLEEYLFNDRQTGGKLLALGYGSLFNHSPRPNVIYKVHSDDQTIEYTSGFQVITQDTELCISYGSNLWFEDAERSDIDVDQVSDEQDDEETFLQRIQVSSGEPNC
jgi:SET domain-containing protein